MQRHSVCAGRARLACRPARQAVVVRAGKVEGGPTLAIVGVTGAVGQEFLRVGGRGG